MTAATLKTSSAMAGRNCWDPRAWATEAAKPIASSQAGRNCWDPTTWTDGFDTAPVPGPVPSPSLTDLKNPLVQDLVKQAVCNFFRGVMAPIPTSAPMNPERFSSIDATPAYLMGAKYQAYNINGELMVKVSPVTSSPGQATWYDLGKVPSADVVSPAPSHNCWDPATWGASSKTATV